MIIYLYIRARVRFTYKLLKKMRIWFNKSPIELKYSRDKSEKKQEKKKNVCNSTYNYLLISNNLLLEKNRENYLNVIYFTAFFKISLLLISTLYLYFIFRTFLLIFYDAFRICNIIYRSVFNRGGEVKNYYV